MIVFGTSKTQQIPGPSFPINCRACGREGVPARSFVSEERMRLYAVVPVPTQRERHVVCTACGADRLTDLSWEELTVLAPDVAERHIFERVSFVTKFLAIAGLVLFPVPLVGLVLGLIAMVQTRRTRGWPFRVAQTGVILAALLYGGLLAWSALVALKVV